MPTPSNLLRVAEFGAAHGLKGEVRVKVMVEEPDLLLGRPLTTEDGRTFTLRSLRPAKTVMIARVDGVRFRDQAEALNRLPLYLDRADLPEADEGEFYAADLIGCDAVDERGERVGRIRSVPDFGAGDLLEIEGAAGGGSGTWFLDFTLANVPDIDLEGRRVTVRVPDETSEREEDDGTDEAAEP